MNNKQLTVSRTYKLPEKDRQAIILASSDFVKKSQKIEFQRRRFIAKNGDEFGQKLTEKTINFA